MEDAQLCMDFGRSAWKTIAFPVAEKIAEGSLGANISREDAARTYTQHIPIWDKKKVRAQVAALFRGGQCVMSFTRDGPEGLWRPSSRMEAVLWIGLVCYCLDYRRNLIGHWKAGDDSSPDEMREAVLWAEPMPSWLGDQHSAIHDNRVGYSRPETPPLD